MRIDSMLAAIDFSEAAIDAARWAADYFAPEARLTLAHVVEAPELPAFARLATTSADEIEAAARVEAEARIRDVAAHLSRRAPRCEVRIGKPYEQITALVEAVDADLVVIGPHGSRRRRSKFLGTTADRIVRTSMAPVLVASAPRASRPRKMLVAIDDSSITPLVLEWARDLASAFDAAVVLLHVWSNAVYSHVASMSHATAHGEAEARADIAKELDDAARHWLAHLIRTGMNEERVTAFVTHGRAGDVVLEVAANTQADLIVLGRRGSGLVAPALLGSTVGTVLHGARCPVLVITEQRKAKDD